MLSPYEQIISAMQDKQNAFGGIHIRRNASIARQIVDASDFTVFDEKTFAYLCQQEKGQLNLLPDFAQIEFPDNSIIIIAHCGPLMARVDWKSAKSPIHRALTVYATADNLITDYDRFLWEQKAALSRCVQNAELAEEAGKAGEPARVLEFTQYINNDIDFVATPDLAFAMRQKARAEKAMQIALEKAKQSQPEHSQSQPEHSQSQPEHSQSQPEPARASQSQPEPARASQSIARASQSQPEPARASQSLARASQSQPEPARASKHHQQTAGGCPPPNQKRSFSMSTRRNLSAAAVNEFAEPQKELNLTKRQYIALSFVELLCLGGLYLVLFMFLFFGHFNVYPQYQWSLFSFLIVLSLSSSAITLVVTD